MYTKAFKYAQSLYSVYFSDSAVYKGYYKAKNTNGYDGYIGNYSTNPMYLNFDQFMNPNSSNINGYGFSNDSTPFVDDGTVALPTLQRNLSCTKSLRSLSAVGGKLAKEFRYILTNNNSEEVTLYKFVASFEANSSSTYAGSVSSSMMPFLGYVQEFSNPVTIPANGTAIIDVTIETEIPE